MKYIYIIIAGVLFVLSACSGNDEPAANIQGAAEETAGKAASVISEDTSGITESSQQPAEEAGSEMSELAADAIDALKETSSEQMDSLVEETTSDVAAAGEDVVEDLIEQGKEMAADAMPSVEEPEMPAQPTLD